MHILEKFDDLEMSSVSLMEIPPTQFVLLIVNVMLSAE